MVSVRLYCALNSPWHDNKQPVQHLLFARGERERERERERVWVSEWVRVVNRWDASHNACLWQEREGQSLPWSFLQPLNQVQPTGSPRTLESSCFYTYSVWKWLENMLPLNPRWWPSATFEQQKNQCSQFWLKDPNLDRVTTAGQSLCLIYISLH